VAYIVRVGTGAHSYLNLEDRTPAPLDPGTALRIDAKKEGKAGDIITVAVDDDHLQITEIASGQANITEIPSDNDGKLVLNKAVVDDASAFRPGDKVEIRNGVPPTPAPSLILTPAPTPAPPSTEPEITTITRIRREESGNYTVTFADRLKYDYTNGTMTIPDLKPGDTKFRVNDARKIERGSVIKISQGGKEEPAEVANVVLLPAEPEGTRHGFLTLKKGLENPYDLTNATPVSIESQEFKLVFTGPGGASETFEGLSMDPDHSRFYQNVVDSKLINVLSPDEPSVAPPPNNRPKAILATNLTNGADDDITQLEATHYREGIETLERVDDVNILCAPDAADEPGLQAAVQADLVTHCEKMMDRFAILDPLDKTADGETLAGKDPTDETGILAQRQSVASADGRAALYYPRIRIQNPEGRGQIIVPPSGHIAGIYARVDMERGVHKAPANETINGALGLGLKDDRVITDEEQGELNVMGINVIRVFPLQGVTVWGARTVSHLTAWRYINVRRLFLMVEESIQEGTKWVVFEPNDLSLWGKIKRVVTDFLTRVWRDGGLFGATPEEAFYVKVDEEINPPAVRQLGQVIIEVGIAPVFPAEFVIFRIGQKVGGAEVTELA
jgi:hypothetical protein